MDYFEINTEHLVLKPLEKKYLKSAIRYTMDYENTKFMCHLPDKAICETEDFLISVSNEWKKENPRFLGFAIIYNYKHIGEVSVYFENDTGELSWIINKHYWGNGFAYEAAKALIYYIKSEINITHFMAHCNTANIVKIQ